MANIVSNTPYIKLIDKSDRGSEMNVSAETGECYCLPLLSKYVFIFSTN